MPEKPPFPAALAEPPDGLPFPAHDIATLETADGYRLRAAFFPLPKGQNARGTILLLQGRAEFIEKYREVIGELLGRGFAVATFDWRGQGGSERLLRNRKAGHVEDFEDFQLDLDAMIAEMITRGLPQPWAMLAHSTGGAIALHHIARGPSPFRRAVLTSPLIGIAGPGGGVAGQVLSRLLSALGLATWRIPFGTDVPRTQGPFEGNPFTRDRARYTIMGQWLEAHPGLGIGDPTIGWVAAAFHALDRFAQPGFGRLGRTPVLMLLAGADKVVSTAAAEQLALDMRNASALVLPGARHEILMETGDTRALFWAAFDAFVPGEEI
ncbi:MAG: alpha/beta hydrolase [Beijerinckiaceae bacterium]|jgi:lysophospholipase|nr:alpha/beta hydrolase [Beijerinckiaceae bacterium]